MKQLKYVQTKSNLNNNISDIRTCIVKTEINFKLQNNP